MLCVSLSLSAPTRFSQVTEDFAIQPEKITPTLDASKWPLLLKNYDKLMVRHSVLVVCVENPPLSFPAAPLGTKK